MFFSEFRDSENDVFKANGALFGKLQRKDINSISSFFISINNEYFFMNFWSIHLRLITSSKIIFINFLLIFLLSCYWCSGKFKIANRILIFHRGFLFSIHNTLTILWAMINFISITPFVLGRTWFSWTKLKSFFFSIDN